MFSIYDQMDVLLQAQGAMLEAGGVGPEEAEYSIVLEERTFRLREYAGAGARLRNGPVVLLVPAPIKKAYIWDLQPGASVIRKFLESGVRNYLMEWKAPHAGDEGLGLKEYAGSFIEESIKKIKERTGQGRVFIAGHSLGGTLAAIYASYKPEDIKGIILAAGPVHFGEGVGSLDTAVALFGGLHTEAGILGNIPGAFLDVVATGADPWTFVMYPFQDLIQSMGEREAVRTHFLVRRWMLDETPIPKKLFREVVELLYRDDLFMKGKLKLNGSPAAPDRMDFPVLAIIDRECRIVTPRSVLPLFEKIKSTDTKILWYEGDKGILFRHAGVLVGKSAHAHIWPEAVAWLHSHG